MKKIILMCFVIVVNFGAYAQSPYGNSGVASDSTKTSGISMSDGFVNKDGKMMMVNNGQFTSLKKDMTLPDGTVVMTNGTYKAKNGSKMELKEGDHLDMSGNLSTSSNSMNNNDPNNKTNDHSRNSSNGHTNSNMNDNNMNNQTK